MSNIFDGYDRMSSTGGRSGWPRRGGGRAASMVEMDLDDGRSQASNASNRDQMDERMVGVVMGLIDDVPVATPVAGSKPDEYKMLVKEGLDAFKTIIETPLFHRLYDGAKLVDYVAKARNKAREYVDENVTKVYQHTADIMDLSNTICIPQHCTRVVQSDIYGEKRFPIQPSDTATGFSFKVNVQPQMAYGHCTNHSQGTITVTKSKPDGNLANTYIAKLYLDSVRNPLPYALGVIVTEESVSKEAKELPHKGAFDALSNRLFHGIIPPNSSNVEVVLYRNTLNADDEWGAKYPDLTADGAVILKGVMRCPGDDEKLAVPIGPLAEYIFQICRLHNWPFPELGDTPDPKKAYIVCTKQMVKTAAEGLKKYVNNNIPVFNIGDLCIKFYPIFNETTSLNIKREVHERIQKYGEVPKVSAQDQTSQTKKLLIESFHNEDVVSFRLRTVHIFREIARMTEGPSVEKAATLGGDDGFDDPYADAFSVRR